MQQRDFASVPNFAAAQNSASILVRLSMFIFIAWRNVWRYPIRSCLTISALAGGLVIVIIYATLLEGMSRQMVRYATEVSTGHIQLHRQAFIDDQDMYATLPWSYLDSIETEFPTIRFAPRLYAAGLASAGEFSTGVMIKAVHSEREKAATSILDHMQVGEMNLSQTTNPDSPDGVSFNVIIGAQMAKNLELSPGSELVLVTQAVDGSIGNALYRVAGVLSPMEPNFDRMGVLMSVAAYRQLMSLQDGFHELVVRLSDIDQLEAIQAALAAKVSALEQVEPLDEIGGQSQVRNWRELNPAVSDMLELSNTMIIIMGLIIVGMASLGMLNTMLMAVHERAQEFGILFAVGMKRRWIMSMVLIESLYLALVSAIVGAGLGVAIGYYIQEHGIDFSGAMEEGYDWAGMHFEPVMQGYILPEHVLKACLLMIIVAMISSLIPSWRVLRLNPAEMI